MTTVTQRCDGKNYRTFLCCLDDGHDGTCMPYRQPTVDEWRAMNAHIRALGELVDRWQDKCDEARRILS